MEENDDDKSNEILKLLQAQTKISINFPLLTRLAQKPMLGNKETAALLSVSVRQMCTLRTSRGLGFFRIKRRPYHLWSHIIAYIEDQIKV